MVDRKRVEHTETIHPPHARDDVHWQDDRAENCEPAEDVVGLLCPLVHADVDLGEVVRVGAGQDAAIMSVC